MRFKSIDGIDLRISEGAVLVLHFALATLPSLERRCCSWQKAREMYDVADVADIA